MKKYMVWSERDGNLDCFYIYNTEDMCVEPAPSKYLMHMTRAKNSPNTIERAARALSYFMLYMDEKEVKLTDVYQMGYEKQYHHFVDFLYWLKQGKHKEKFDKPPHDGTCNAYLQDVFRFYLFMEQCEWRGKSLAVLSYSQFITPNETGVKKILRSYAFKGYLKAEERNVKAAKRDEIVELLEACTNCRDQLLILLLAETGFRIGELLGVDYTRDIDYENHLIKVNFRDDNENGARAKNAEYRYAKISGSTFEFLLYYLSEYRKLIQKQKYLFITIAGETAGQSLNVDTVYDMLDRLEKKTGIKTTPHMLRRYFGNERWRSGWPLEMISHAYGHKHLDTTIKYLNIIDDSLIEASDRYYEENSSMYDISRVL